MERGVLFTHELQCLREVVTRFGGGAQIGDAIASFGENVVRAVEGVLHRAARRFGLRDLLHRRLKLQHQPLHAL
jgi:hypothetical protein